MNCRYCHQPLDGRDSGLRGWYESKQSIKYTRRCPQCGAGFIEVTLPDGQTHLAEEWDEPGTYDTTRGDDDAWYAKEQTS